MPEVVTKLPPENGLWRVGRGPDPFALRDPSPPLLPDSPADPAIGHRFDSALGDYRVWYFATTLEGCYGETLAVLRPAPAVTRAVGDDDEGFMPLGEVPADWRTRRLAVRATFPEDRPFLDVEAAETRVVLRDELGWVLDYVGLDDIDVAAIRSRDRRLTRWVSQWTWSKRWERTSPDYAGLCFRSRLNTDWECWAVFEEVIFDEEERRSVLRQDQALSRVANLYGLDIY
jgi:hypothetical protein